MLPLNGPDVQNPADITISRYGGPGKRLLPIHWILRQGVRVSRVGAEAKATRGARYTSIANQACIVAKKLALSRNHLFH